MAPASNWISYSFAPIEMLLRPCNDDRINSFPFYSFPQDHNEHQFITQPLKLEDFLGGHRSSPPFDPCSETLTDGQDSSSLTVHRDLVPFALPVISSEVEDCASATGNKLSAAVQSPESAFSVARLERGAAEKTAAVGSCQRTSIYRGVTRHRWTGRYEAHLWDNTCRREGQKRKGRQVYLGGYDNEEKAARAYDLAALKYWGLSATTNFPVQNYCTEMEAMKNLTKQEFIASLRRKSSGFSRGASIYRGVTRHHQHGRWQARIGRVAGNKDLYLGTFATEEEAAEAYDVAAIKFRGSNAVTNFELSRYNVEAIASTDLPIGSSAKRMKESLQSSNNAQLPATSSATSHHRSTEPPAVLSNHLQLQTTADPSVPLAFCTMGENSSELCQSLYWFTPNGQHCSQIHSNQLGWDARFSN